MSVPALDHDEGVSTRILRVATELFAERGYGLTSVQDIAQTAGVTKPTLYYHHGNKDALFQAAVAAALREVTRATMGAMDGDAPLEDRLVRYLEVFIARGRANDPALRLVLTAQHPPNTAEPALDLLSLYMESGQMLALHLQEAAQRREVRPDLDLAQAVISLVGIVNILSLCALHGIPLAPDAARSAVHLYLSGVSR